MDFSKKIYKLRCDSNMTQTELAELLDISNRAVSKWESGISMPSTENLYKMSKIFNVPLETFFTDETPVVEEEIKPTGMKSLRELYKTGRGPSSSHTMGPESACVVFMGKNPDADCFEVTLFGSLAKTGVGHGTDTVIKKTFAPKPVKITLDYSETNLPHPNTMDMYAYKDGVQLDYQRVMSIGGGKIKFENDIVIEASDTYEHRYFSDISAYCEEHQLSLCEYIELSEGSDIWNYLAMIWDAMKRSIEDGIVAHGILPGGLNIQKKANILISQRHIDESAETRENRMVCAYAFAVGEQNACGEKIVTAPTCGAAGVVPAVLYYQQKKRGFTDEQILRALAVGGLVGNLIKTNASISGAECGCQAEIGTACAMAAAGLSELFGLDMSQTEYAAEIAIEHHLGLTCDPICGLVQIPCIERNAVAAMRAINAVSLASFLSDTRKISLDKVIKTMKETGDDISKRYKETSEGGLAKIRIS